MLGKGFHPKSLEGIRKSCVDKFPLSSTRSAIMDGLEYMIGKLQEAGVSGKLWVDGSFTTEKINPEDVDTVIEIFIENEIELTEQQYTTLSWMQTLRDNHFCDAYVFVRYPEDDDLHDEGEEGRDYWEDLFGTTRAGEPKGIMTINI